MCQAVFPLWALDIAALLTLLAKKPHRSIWHPKHKDRQPPCAHLYRPPTGLPNFGQELLRRRYIQAGNNPSDGGLKLTKAQIDYARPTCCTLHKLAIVRPDLIREGRIRARASVFLNFCQLRAT